MRILIADDSIVSRHLLDATLRKWGYEVVAACDGVEAWNILQAPDAPSLAILDWVMPGMTGPEVCRKVREHAKDSKEQECYTYILLLTSKSLKEDLIEGMESGADDYVTKPFDQHELKVRLRAGTRIIDLQRQLREQATKDFLLHIWNRSSILDILQRELIRGGRENRGIGVVLADLDHFKSINDTYGHFAGDEVLREFARRMQNSIRPYDAIGRYGGEEFLIVLPGSDESGTAHQAERMRKALDAEPILINDTRRAVTCSFGATSWRPGTPADSEMLIRVADDALYAAKHQGRNRVVYYPESVGNVVTK
ncbi:MAG TPA: diguanylate cyclase [Bryobacteraceae bacterium]|jgi:diguanylate cyclase (GGDEF)-like protein|nr:diguanylate cyclase [Bryobacteraceae bacterium]